MYGFGETITIVSPTYMQTDGRAGQRALLPCFAGHDRNFTRKISEYQRSR